MEVSVSRCSGAGYMVDRAAAAAVRQVTVVMFAQVARLLLLTVAIIVLAFVGTGSWQSLTAP
jgi:hypothetical protein